MKYKIGQELYLASAIDEDGKCSVDTYIVRTIRGGFVYAILYLPGVTWVKLSTKNGDYGWARNIDPIFRKQCAVNETFWMLHTTKRQAWMDLIKRVKENPRNSYEPEIQAKIFKTVQRHLSALKKG